MSIACLRARTELLSSSLGLSLSPSSGLPTSSTAASPLLVPRAIAPSLEADVSCRRQAVWGAWSRFAVPRPGNAPRPPPRASPICSLSVSVDGRGSGGTRSLVVVYILGPVCFPELRGVSLAVRSLFRAQRTPMGGCTDKKRLLSRVVFSIVYRWNGGRSCRAS